MSWDTAKYPIEIFLSDVVSDQTRRERTALLMLCALAIVIATTGLVPSKISALGIEFSATDQRRLLLIVAGALAYLTSCVRTSAVSGPHSVLSDAFRSKASVVCRDSALTTPAFFHSAGKTALTHSRRTAGSTERAPSASQTVQDSDTCRPRGSRSR